ncbi:MAG: beta-galactosidase [Bacillota bacterium]|nr:MAG: beta-galactosidase [Bacillota bacterium]
MFRSEHPKPQFMRKNWQNLNGIWEFERDDADSGEERALFAPSAAYRQTICVPFCPESELSGVGYKDFMLSVWYRRTFVVSKENLAEKIYLHFGAVDYEAVIYVNGEKCGAHRGGYVSFCVDITNYVREGENAVCVHAKDDTRNRLVPSGKQSEKLASYGCFYTRTTGIWQTVWLEYLPKTHIESVKYYPDADSGTLAVHAKLCGAGKFSVKTSFGGAATGCAETYTSGGSVTLAVPLTEKHLWELGKGGLYDVALSFGEDEVQSYFGLRKIEYRDKKFFLNGKSTFQRLILDQGFYPDGIYTAPSDEALLADIHRAKAAGFNGARLHEKVFEERFLYHCDREGYIVWGEYPNWGLDVSYADAVYPALNEWLEEVERDFNHPSIVGWCPFNETWDTAGRKQFDGVLETVYRATKAVDGTRPVIDTSGNYHVVTDIYDVHCYEQNPEKFAEIFAELAKSGKFKDFMPRQEYTEGLPFFVSEYGGTARATDGWGYGEAPKSEEAWLDRVRALTDALLDNPNIFAFCYTQLTDVEQEQNGLYAYDRTPKFAVEKLYSIFARKAAVEE